MHFQSKNKHTLTHRTHIRTHCGKKSIFTYTRYIDNSTIISKLHFSRNVYVTDLINSTTCKAMAAYRIIKADRFYFCFISKWHNKIVRLKSEREQNVGIEKKKEFFLAEIEIENSNGMHRMCK